MDLSRGCFEKCRDEKRTLLSPFLSLQARNFSHFLQVGRECLLGITFVSWPLSNDFPVHTKLLLSDSLNAVQTMHSELFIKVKSQLSQAHIYACTSSGYLLSSPLQRSNQQHSAPRGWFKFTEIICHTCVWYQQGHSWISLISCSDGETKSKPCGRSFS